MNNPKDLQSHWNTAYNKEDQKLGWFEENPAQTMQLIESCKLETDAKILNVGVGTTTLIEALLDKGYTNLIANDLSPVALKKLKDRILKSHGYTLNCIADDLTNPTLLQNLEPIDVWVDSLGADFQLIDSFNHTFITPFGGERPYIYTLFKRC